MARLGGFSGFYFPYALLAASFRRSPCPGALRVVRGAAKTCDRRN